MTEDELRAAGLPVPRDAEDQERLRQSWSHGCGSGLAGALRRDGKPSKRNPYTHNLEETT